MPKSYYEDVNNVIILISGQDDYSCLECDLRTGSFQEIINHYLKHEYKLLHIGTEGSAKGDYPTFETAAYLGR
ncbi:MAG: hypothetical protein AB1401_14710 [Thermodesulfobacteriota bacterium]